MPFPDVVSGSARASLADVEHVPFWLDRVDAPEVRPALVNDIEADLVVVGGGFSGLWTAYQATQRFPDWDIVLLEADHIASGATGRNGGFCAASLTHGLPNGHSRWPTELRELVRQGRDNLAGILRTVESENITCDLITSGELDMAIEPYQVDDLHAVVELAASVDEHLTFLDAEAVRQRISSPTYLGAVLDSDSVVMLDPARLAWGLADACRRRGVRIYESTTATGLDEAGPAMLVRSDFGSVRAGRVALGTAAYPALLRRLKWYVVPVYDSVLVTEPLSAAQHAAIGWSGREGASDSGNQFHYYRMTEDGRILWGGYDASYYGSFNPHFERRGEPFARLASHFFWTFPQLEGLRFTHAWAGAIDTSSRFSAFWGTAYDGKVAYSLGFTGLGVGASRFGANVMLDLLAHESTERTKLQMVQTRPLPFPPEPIRKAGINVTRRALAAADDRQGRRNAWLRVLDRIGLGFDS